MRTAFTQNEWAEFCDGFDDPGDAYDVANMIWDRERFEDLTRLRPFCTDDESQDLLEAAFALAPTSSSIFHEIEERLLSYLYDHSEDYRSERYFRGCER